MCDFPNSEEIWEKEKFWKKGQKVPAVFDCDRQMEKIVGDLVWTVCPHNHSIQAFDTFPRRWTAGIEIDFACRGSPQEGITYSVENRSAREIHLQFTVSMFSLVRGERIHSFSSSWRAYPAGPAGPADPERAGSVRVGAPPAFGQLMNTDIIKIYCRLNILRLKRGCPGPPKLLAEEKERRRSALNHVLSNAFFNPAHADMELLCRGQRIPCHRFLLASRSGVLRSALEESAAAAAADDDVREYDISEHATPKSARDLLYFVYTGRLLDTRSGPVVDLLRLACTFRVHSLRERCSEALVPALCAKNAVRLARVAHRHGLERLRVKAVQFVASNVPAITSSVSLADELSGDCRYILADVVRLMAARATCSEQGRGVKLRKERLPVTALLPH